MARQLIPKLLMIAFVLGLGPAGCVNSNKCKKACAKLQSCATGGKDGAGNGRATRSQGAAPGCPFDNNNCNPRMACEADCFSAASCETVLGISLDGVPALQACEEKCAQLRTEAGLAIGDGRASTDAPSRPDHSAFDRGVPSDADGLEGPPQDGLANLPELYIKTFTATPSGTVVTYDLLVCNRGAATALPFKIGVYFDPLSTPGCTSPESISRPITGLGRDECFTTQLTREGAANGAHNDVARVDADCEVGESNETNNSATASYTVGEQPVTKPEFYIKSFTARPSGSSVTYTVEACNRGGATSVQFEVGIYFDPPTPPGCTSNEDIFPKVQGLAAGACTTIIENRTNVPVGSHSDVARVDSDCDIAESDETNNNETATYSIVP